ncbi:MAG: protein-L-isoaspartate(D-aspartate) O-methyltransferase [Myxococcales bacterium]|nr:protein-L-isoaspartate(D-aspartate) O-methyltransferase [Myxococcales bacterium]
MVREQIAARGVKDRRVLDAMRKVPRHLFVPPSHRALAYADRPLPIGHSQTISQPYIVGYMSEALQLSRLRGRRRPKVLEIGTGSGYQAAVLAAMGAEVYSIEIVAPLGQRARAVLAKLGYKHVHVRIGDGYAGDKGHTPFDAVILTAAPPKIPQPLIDQLRVGGVLVAPEGRHAQRLIRITRTTIGLRRERLFGVRFVPMTGKAQRLLDKRSRTK